MIGNILKYIYYIKNNKIKIYSINNGIISNEEINIINSYFMIKKYLEYADKKISFESRGVDKKINDDTYYEYAVMKYNDIWMFKLYSFGIFTIGNLGFCSGNIKLAYDNGSVDINDINHPQQNTFDIFTNVLSCFKTNNLIEDIRISILTSKYEKIIGNFSRIED